MGQQHGAATNVQQMVRSCADQCHPFVSCPVVPNDLFSGDDVEQCNSIHANS